MKDTDIFDGKKLSDLLKDIHDNTTVKRQDIGAIIRQLTGMMTTPNDAVLIIPLIKEFYDVGIKNDDQLVKIATIVQRLISAESYSDGDSGVMLTDAEKDRLIENAMQDMNAYVSSVDTTLEKAKEKLDGI